MTKNKQNGYTLIELLAVVIVLVAVGTIIASILTAVLRSSSKSAATENVRKNGNYAISQMSRMITYAQKFEGISVDNKTYYSDCVSQPTSKKYYYLQIMSFDGGITTFTCSTSRVASQSSTMPLQSPTGSKNYLVDPALSIKSCYFNCTQASAAAPAKIDIFLDLKAKSSSIFSESQAEIPFQTSVVIRNSSSR